MRVAMAVNWMAARWQQIGYVSHCIIHVLLYRYIVTHVVVCMCVGNW